MELRNVRPATLVPALLITFLAGLCMPVSAFAQQLVLLLNVTNEGQTCLKRLEPAYPNPASTCTDGNFDAPFLRQGRRTELRVFNRKFLTDYTLTVDAVTSLQTGPNIRNLSEAEGLTFNAPSFALPPPSKGGAEGLTSRTANTILFQLLDETSASQPESDLRADFTIIEREHARIQQELAAFNKSYTLLRGNPAAPALPLQCGKVAGSPDAENVLRCLTAELDREFLPPWAGTSYLDEQEFRKVNIRVQDVILAVKALGSALSSTDLLSKEQKIETDVAQYENDLVVFKGNAEAAYDAAELVLHMNEGYRKRLSRERMKVTLTDKLKTQGDNKPVLDEAGVNELLNKYESSYAATLYIPQARWQKLCDAAGAYLHEDYLRHTPVASEFHDDVEKARGKLGVDLPGVVDGVNAQQSRLLARVNEIYDHSQVAEPLSKQFDLSGHGGNLIVYYTIRRVEGFARYTVTPISGPGGAAQANAAGTPLPPPSKGATAPAPADGQAGGSPQAVDTSGTVVARGQFEVHDFYNANVVAAFAFSTLKNQSISKQAQPKSCGGSDSNPDPNCFAPILNGELRQFEPIVGVDWYLRTKDTFPGQHCTRDWLQCLGIMGAVSVRKADSFYAGVFLEPTLGIQLAAGANFGTQTTLQSAYKFGQPADISGDVTFEQRKIGAFFSAGLDLAIFRKIFGKVTGIGTSATNTQGK